VLGLDLRRYLSSHSLAWLLVAITEPDLAARPKLLHHLHNLSRFVLASLVCFSRDFAHHQCLCNYCDHSAFDSYTEVPNAGLLKGLLNILTSSPNEAMQTQALTVLGCLARNRTCFVSCVLRSSCSHSLTLTCTATCRAIIMKEGGSVFLKPLLDHARRCVVISVHRHIPFEEIEVREQLASGLGSVVHLARLGGQQVTIAARSLARSITRCSVA